MGKTMITGGLGFVGAYLVRSLNHQGTELTVISRSRNAHFDSISQLRGVRVVIKDLSELTEDDLDGVDRVYHLASTVHNYHIQTDPYVDVKTNVEGTIRLLEIARRLGRPEVIFASSWFVYGRQDVLPVREDAHCRPLALYGATKLCAEHCLRSYGAVFGIPFKIVRLGNVIGPGDINASAQKGALLHLLRKIKASEPVALYYGGDFIRDYIYVEDAVRGL